MFRVWSDLRVVTLFVFIAVAWVFATVVSVGVKANPAPFALLVFSAFSWVVACLDMTGKNPYLMTASYALWRHAETTLQDGQAMATSNEVVLYCRNKTGIPLLYTPRVICFDIECTEQIARIGSGDNYAAYATVWDLGSSEGEPKCRRAMVELSRVGQKIQTVVVSSSLEDKHATAPELSGLVWRLRNGATPLELR